MQTRQFYINGSWTDPIESTPLDVINPATEESVATISLGSAKDLDRAVTVAREAFESFQHTTPDERAGLLDRIVEVYQTRAGDLAKAISDEMGAPMWLANNAQVPSGLMHYATAAELARSYDFEEQVGNTMIRKEPIGVCGLISPWNWPSNQIACKVAPAIACGCTMILKPSEVAPLSALVIAEILDEAGVPAGVFNLVNGDGPTVGAAMSAHPDIDMVSFTGSTRAGVEVAKSAAPSVKRVTQELGGKSANIILDDADLKKAIPAGVIGVLSNTGQSCNAPTRMLVPHGLMDEVCAIAAATVEKFKVGDPKAEDTRMGPLASKVQFDKVQALIQKGIDEGAKVVIGGTGRPDGLNKGYFVKPTIFANVTNDMTIAREEIFGPVLVIIGYKDVTEAIAIANDTPYGLSGYVSGSDMDRVRMVAKSLRTGNVHINSAGPDFKAPFGGYKQSGNGREWGAHGFAEYLEAKAMLGYYK